MGSFSFWWDTVATRQPPGPPPAPPPTEAELNAMLKPEVLAIATDMGLTLDGTETKDALIALILANQ